MSVVDRAQVFTGIAAILAVFVALWQARISRDAARDQLRMSREDLKVHLLLQYEDRWEAPTMMALRRALAGRLLDSHVYRAGSALPDSTYDVIGDEIPGFFEASSGRTGHGTGPMRGRIWKVWSGHFAPTVQPMAASARWMSRTSRIS